MLEKGYKVNFLTIIDNTKIKDNNKTYYLCKCDCGNKKNILAQSLRTKRIRDCGCGQFMLTKYIGEKIGKLSVVRCFRERRNGKINIIVNCKCDCNSNIIKTMPYSEFKKGKITSCGCLNKFDFNKKYKGKIYNGIEIIEVASEKNHIAKCKCHCGNYFNCKLYDLTSNKKYIIGCNKCSNNGFKMWEEKSYRPRLKRIYNGMLQRCYNSECKDYKWYGEKGIKVCKEWLNEFTNFYNWAINNEYKEHLSIDRIDSEGDYEPNNCRWATSIQQQNNRKNNVKFFIDNKYLSIKEISKIYGINPNTLRSRLYVNKNKMTIEEALRIPVKKRG